MQAMHRNPFGREDCESELAVLRDEYRSLYFNETPFNASSLAPQTYLIVGRRGSGKTALAQYFSFQEILKDPIYIDVNEPDIYQSVLQKLAASASTSRETVVPHLQQVWEYAIWQLIGNELQNRDHLPSAAHDHIATRHTFSLLLARLFERIDRFYRTSDTMLMEEQALQDSGFRSVSTVRQAAIRLARTRPIFIVIDTLERYELNNTPLMDAIAALIQCAATFNTLYSDHNIHLKIFVSGEIFPHLQESVLQNPLKSVKDPAYLLWRPRDLLRLICWRLYHYLAHNELLDQLVHGDIDWEDYQSVHDRMWAPCFGTNVKTRHGMDERPFPYILRHTQMRPRQLIKICNNIARLSVADGTFPHFAGEHIRDGIREAETDLAAEIINSYTTVYEHVGTIVNALMNMPAVFLGNELDRRAKQTSSAWPYGTYSLEAFRQLVADLGIVGRVWRQNDDAGYIDAEFQYGLRSRLILTHRDLCAIHPMFYGRFNVVFDDVRQRVMPFATDRTELVDQT